jgi:adenosylcobinamide kinase/adenosylcobinamide-phosphate guanylyltransferase
MSLTFITGPVRSGKSRFAERLALESGLAVTYVATARTDRDDAEWVARLAHHAARRPASWALLETALPGAADLAQVAREARASDVLLVDSLGTWLADQMERSAACAPGGTTDPGALEAAGGRLGDAVVTSAARIVLVSEEVGWSVVPEHASGRLFRDALGRLNQRLAREAERAYLVVSGFALDLAALAERTV